MGNGLTEVLFWIIYFLAHVNIREINPQPTHCMSSVLIIYENLIKLLAMLITHMQMFSEAGSKVVSRIITFLIILQVNIYDCQMSPVYSSLHNTRKCLTNKSQLESGWLFVIIYKDGNYCFSWVVHVCPCVSIYIILLRISKKIKLSSIFNLAETGARVEVNFTP